MSLSEQEFRVKSDQALDAARHALLPLADSDGFEVELQNGVLNLVFEEPVETKFVVSPNAPVRQIWVSAMSRSFKLSWAPDLGAFALDGEALPALLERIRAQFGVSGRLSGSGSACFAILNESFEAGPLENVIREAWGPSAFIAETRIA